MTVQGVSDTEEVLAPETATREGSPTRNSGIRMPDPSTAVTGRRVVAPALTVPKETSTAQPTAARTSTAATATGAATAASRVDASAATAADVQAQPFAVQAKSFADEALATEFADNLRRKIKSYPRKAFEHGMPEVYVAQAVLKAGEPPWNRVRIGHFSTRTAANQFKLVLEQREGYEVWIVDR
jgi:cell division septation protein DedD